MIDVAEAPDTRDQCKHLRQSNAQRLLGGYIVQRRRALQMVAPLDQQQDDAAYDQGDRYGHGIEKPLLDPVVQQEAHQPRGRTQ